MCMLPPPPLGARALRMPSASGQQTWRAGASPGPQEDGRRGGLRSKLWSAKKKGES